MSWSLPQPEGHGPCRILGLAQEKQYSHSPPGSSPGEQGAQLGAGDGFPTPGWIFLSPRMWQGCPWVPNLLAELGASPVLHSPKVKLGLVGPQQAVLLR